MNGNDDDIKYEQELSGHLAARLDPHRGRAFRTFEEKLRLEQARGRGQQSWLMAASIALLFMCGAVLAIWSSRRPAAPPQLMAEVHQPVTAPSTDQPRDVTQLVAWEASDEGVESVTVRDRLMPVRKVRREAVETTQWFDPQRNATLKLTVPVEQVILIQEDTY